MTRHDSRHRQSIARLRGSLFERVLVEVLVSADLFPVAGNISAPGEEDRYAITMADPARVPFDALSDAELTWVLQGPGGATIHSM